MENEQFLVVDDDESWARQIAEWLGPFGRGVCATSYEQGEEYLREEAWCGMVVDLHLGHRSGIALAECARAQMPTLPITLITGYHHSRVGRSVYRSGIDYLEKDQVDEGSMSVFALDCLRRRSAEHFIDRALALYRPYLTAIDRLSLRDEIDDQAGKPPRPDADVGTLYARRTRLKAKTGKSIEQLVAQIYYLAIALALAEPPPKPPSAHVPLPRPHPVVSARLRGQPL